MAGNQVTLVCIVKGKNGLHAYRGFVARSLGVCSEHEGSNCGDVKERRRFTMGGWISEKRMVGSVLSIFRCNTMVLGDKMAMKDPPVALCQLPEGSVILELQSPCYGNQQLI